MGIVGSQCVMACLANYQVSVFEEGVQLVYGMFLVRKVGVLNGMDVFRR